MMTLPGFLSFTLSLWIFELAYGTKLTFNTQNDEIEQLQMYGLIRNDNNSVRVSNRILETMELLQVTMLLKSVL